MSKYQTYAEKLKDPRWQKKRLEIMERDEFQCRYCRSKENTLHVHHRHYRKGAMPWDYEDHLLVTLCEECHQQAEERKAHICEKLGWSRVRDTHLVKICSAISCDPVELTFFGWAAESLSDAIEQAQNVEKDYDSDPESAANSMYEMKDRIADCIEHLHRALFRINETYPDK